MKSDYSVGQFWYHEDYPYKIECDRYNDYWVWTDPPRGNCKIIRGCFTFEDADNLIQERIKEDEK